MNDTTVRQWLQKADNDYKTGIDELATEKPATDTVCFHMQQCVEKYLKGYLASVGREIRKTHNLSLILADCQSVDASFGELLEKKVDSLTPHATVLRYPDEFYMPSLEEARAAVSLADDVKRFVSIRLVFSGTDGTPDT